MTKKVKLCIVTEFPQENYFQWHMALSVHGDSRIELSSTILSEDILKAYPIDDKQWDCIRKSDVIFVYCVRQDLNWEWYKLPLLVKEINPNAKIICQFDLEFLWLFYPDHHFWTKEVKWEKGKTPQEFFDDTKILDVADAHIIFFNDKLRKYTAKPIYLLPLPQLVRYENYTYTKPSKKDFEDKSRKIAVMHHSVKSASIDGTITNVVKPLNIPSAIFTARDTNWEKKLSILEILPHPNKSVVYGMIPRDSYMDFLQRCYVAIDDNDGYYGWSRFAMECALAHVPCVGSTIAVKEFFPELYVNHGDYKLQSKLIKKLLTDQDFWLQVARQGKKNVLSKLNTEVLVNKFLEIVKGLASNKPSSSLPKNSKSNNESKSKKNTTGLGEYEYEIYKMFIEDHFPRSIPPRPTSDGTVFDQIAKNILTQSEWDERYGKWRWFIEGKFDASKLSSKKFVRIDDVSNEPVSEVPREEITKHESEEEQLLRENKALEEQQIVPKAAVKDKDIKFTVIVLVSRFGKLLERCLNSIIKQNPDEVRIYIDPIKIDNKTFDKICTLLSDFNMKIFLQALTSDSDKRKCRRIQKNTIRKLMRLRGEDEFKCEIAKEYNKKGTDWSIHHSAHSDCVRNVHRAILESENKWVALIDDDDEWGEIYIKDILTEYSDSDVGIICGDRLVDDKENVLHQKGTVILHWTDVNNIRTPAVIINRDAFRAIHQNISHEPWQDYRRMYWIMRAGYRTIYVPKIFGIVHANNSRDPRRIIQGGGKVWKKITDELDNKEIILKDWDNESE